MTKQTKTVTQFLDELEHPLKAEIEAIRSLVLGANPGITEHVKWNAPSFCYGGEDRITLKLYPPRKIQLVFHRGSKVKDTADFRFHDDSGLLAWVAADRAVVAIQTMDELDEKRAALTAVINRWILANASIAHGEATAPEG